MWLACNGGHHEVVKLLMEMKADCNAADNRNVTPLMAAFKKGHVQVRDKKINLLNYIVIYFPSDGCK